MMIKRIVLIGVVLALLMAGVLVPATPALAATQTLRPNAVGDGTNIDQASPSSSHWSKVDEASPDNNTTYVVTSWSDAAWERDLYNITDHSIGGGYYINYITVYARCYSNATSGKLRIAIKTGGTVYQSSEKSLTTTYANYSQQWTTNPKTGSAFTLDEIDSLQIGINLYSAADRCTYCTQVYVVVNYSAITAPTVTTQAVSNIEETTATGNGNITSTGGQNPTRYIQWGLTTSYGSQCSAGTGGTGTYSCGITGLSPGTLYHVRAKATDSGGTSYGSDVTFTTKPNAPTSLNATTISSTQIDVSWTKGSGAEKTMVRRKVGSYPTSVSDGDQAYFDTGSNFSDTGRSPATHYYYRAWSYKTGAPSSGYSDGYSEDNAITYGPPSVTTNAAANVEEAIATLNGEITATNGANVIARGFEWDIDSGSPYANDWHEDGDFGVEVFTHGLTSLTKGELYYYRAYAINTYGTGYGSEVTFLTKPDEPNTFVATAVSGTQIDFTWVKGTGAQKTYIRGKDGSYPADRADGYEVYFDTGTAASDTGLTGGHIYYYKTWSYATEGGKEQYSDLYDFAYASPGLSLELWFQPITIVTNTGAEGTADSGTTTTLVDDALTQDDDYWNLARLVITETTDHNAPEGETAVVTDFTATDDTLHFAALTAAPESGDTYTVDFGTLPDRAGTAQDGTITWGNNPAGVSVSIGALLPETQAAAEAEAEAVVPEFVPETDAEEMVTPGVEGEGFPLYAMFKDLFGTWAELGGPNISMPYFWKLVAVVFGWIFGTGIMLTTRNIFFGIVAYFIGFGVPAGAMGGVLDLWVPIVYGLGALGVGLLTVKWGVSSL